MSINGLSTCRLALVQKLKSFEKVKYLLFNLKCIENSRKMSNNGDSGRIAKHSQFSESKSKNCELF